jgi:hypothetical protein
VKFVNHQYFLYLPYAAIFKEIRNVLFEMN